MLAAGTRAYLRQPKAQREVKSLRRVAKSFAMREIASG
jgi:hypothetical protein